VIADVRGALGTVRLVHERGRPGVADLPPISGSCGCILTLRDDTSPVRSHEIPDESACQTTALLPVPGLVSGTYKHEALNDLSPPGFSEKKFLT